MYKNKAVKTLFCAIFIILFLTTLIQKNICKSADFLAGIIYPQSLITTEELLSVDYSINALTLDNGTFTATNNDPKVFVYPDQLGLTNHAKAISIFISGLEETSPGEFYLFDEENKILFSSQPNYHNGNNIINIENYNYNKIRFDITNITGTKFKIENIIINPTDRVSYDLRKSLQPVTNVFILYFIGAIILIIYQLIKRFILKNTDKIQNCCILFTIIALFLALFALNPFGISQKISAVTSINKVITLDDFVTNGQLKDFEVVDKNTIQSINTDPWITMDLKVYDLKYTEIKTLDIFLSNLNTDENNAEIYHLQKKPTGMSHANLISLVKGNNTLNITHVFGEVPVMRLDLTTQKDIILGLEKVEINNPSSLFKIYKCYCLNTISMLICIIISLLLYKYGKKFGEVKNIKLWNVPLQTLYFSLVFFSVFLGVLLSIPILAAIGAFAAIFFYALFNNNKIYKNKWCIPALITTVIITVLGILGQKEYISFFVNKAQHQSLTACWFIIWSGIASHLIICILDGKTKDKNSNLFNMITIIFTLYAIAYYIIFTIYNYNGQESDCLIYFTEYMWVYGFMLNTIILIFITVLLSSLGGKRFTLIILIMGFAVYILGNFIKLTYQGTYLKLSDFLLLNDLFRIMSSYIGKSGIIILIGSIALIIIICLIKIKSILKWVDFKANKGVGAMIFVLTITLVGNHMGNFRNLSSENFKLYPPDNYDNEYMNNIIMNFSGEEYADNIKPDVILIMGESVMDVNKLPNITSNLDCAKNIEKHKVCDIISPRYGGGTAAVEMEALTGFTNYFFVQDMVAYNFYFSKGRSVNSLASEFNRNGYKTSALHFNRGSFYNRNIVYDAMGFNEFYDINSFDISDESRMNDNFTKDYLFFDKIKEELENNNQPQFIFGVTIEGHSPYTNKFDETQVKINSPLLNESEINETQQYFQTIKDVDDELGKLIEYLEKRERPTLLYFWGDHLPPLGIYSKIGYFNGETYEKYTTPFVAYSNYKDIKVDIPYISPNQISCQLLMDSGIKYSSYFDYVLSLRQKYPVLHKQLTSNAEGLDDYYSIIYDVLKGDNYVVKD